MDLVDTPKAVSLDFVFENKISLTKQTKIQAKKALRIGNSQVAKGTKLRVAEWDRFMVLAKPPRGKKFIEVWPENFEKFDVLFQSPEKQDEIASIKAPPRPKDTFSAILPASMVSCVVSFETFALDSIWRVLAKADNGITLKPVEGSGQLAIVVVSKQELNDYFKLTV